MPNQFSNLNVPILADGVGVALDISGFGKFKTVNVDGIEGGGQELSIEVSNDPGAANASFSPIARFTQPGNFKNAIIAARFIRTRVTGFRPGVSTQGIVDFAAVDTPVQQFSAIAVPVLADGVGAALDISTFGKFKTIIVDGLEGLQTLTIEITNVAGGATGYAPLVRFNQPGNQGTKEVVARFIRTRVTGFVPGTSTQGRVFLAAYDDTAFVSPPVILNYDGPDAALEINLATDLTNQAILVNEDNVVRTSPMISLNRAALATGPILDITPGGAAIAILVRGGAIDLSIGGSSEELIVSDLAERVQILGGGVELVEFAADTDIHLQPQPGFGILVTQLPLNAAATPGELLTLTGAAHGGVTPIAVGVEATDILLGLNRVVTFATGALATQRAIQALAPTYAFAAASVLTDADNLFINNPNAGVNATITNPRAIHVALNTDLNAIGIGITEDNVVRTGAMLAMARAALATGVMIDLTPGAATSAGINLRGSSIWFSIAGDSHERMISEANNFISVYCGDQLRVQFATTGTTHYRDIKPDITGARNCGQAALGWLTIFETRNAIGITLSDASLGLELKNETIATTGNPQYSPHITQESQVWDDLNNVTAEAQMGTQVQGIENVGALPTADYVIWENIKDAGYNIIATFGSAGDLALAAGGFLAEHGYCLESAPGTRQVYRVGTLKLTGTAAVNTVTVELFDSWEGEALASETVTEGAGGTRFEIDAAGKIITIKGLSQVALTSPTHHIHTSDVGGGADWDVHVEESGGNLDVSWQNSQTGADVVVTAAGLNGKIVETQFVYFTST